MYNYPQFTSSFTGVFSSRIGFNMEQAITARFLEICREHVQIPKLTVLNEDGGMSAEELALFSNMLFHCDNPEYFKDTVVAQGGAWDWIDGQTKSNWYRSVVRTVAKTEDVIAFEQCGQEISQIPAIEKRLLKRAAVIMHGATMSKRYSNIVMLAPRFITFASEDNEEGYIQINARYEWREINGGGVDETAEEKEVRIDELKYWYRIGYLPSETE